MYIHVSDDLSLFPRSMYIKPNLSKFFFFFQGLVKYMCEEKGFAEDRIRNGAKKLAKARQGSTQGRLDSFFKVLPSTPNGTNKRKSEDGQKNGSAKKGKAGGGGKKGFYKR